MKKCVIIYLTNNPQGDINIINAKTAENAVKSAKKTLQIDLWCDNI